jgi:3-deoxy-7-phosphoheptulonate synthase
MSPSHLNGIVVGRDTRTIVVKHSHSKERIVIADLTSDVELLLELLAGGRDCSAAVEAMVAHRDAHHPPAPAGSRRRPLTKIESDTHTMFATELLGDRHDAPAFAIGNTRVGGALFAVIAGPCAVESREQVLSCAAGVAASGASLFRGGAYKPRTSRHSFQGLGASGIELLAEAKRSTGLPIVTELLDVRHVEHVTEVADVIQIGARNMFNVPLLREAGRSGAAVLLKRSFAATIDEFVHAAEYVLGEGNERVILCERGIRTFETAYRFTLDVAAVPVLKQRAQLPVFVDPSHAAGRAELVVPLALAATAAGADGLMIETHNLPAVALCDGEQAVPLEELPALVQASAQVARLRGKALASAVRRVIGAPRRPRAPQTAVA